MVECYFSCAGSDPDHLSAVLDSEKEVFEQVSGGGATEFGEGEIEGFYAVDSKEGRDELLVCYCLGGEGVLTADFVSVPEGVEPEQLAQSFYDLITVVEK